MKLSEIKLHDLYDKPHELKQHWLEDYKKWSAEEIEKLSKFSMNIADTQYKIGGSDKTIIIDNKRGLGQTPNNSNVQYRGFVIMMKVSDFLKVAADDRSTQDVKANTIKYALENHIAIGNPFLEVDIKNDSIFIGGHEGRARAKAILQYCGDIVMPIHAFPAYLRNRDITPEIKTRLMGEITTQRREKILGKTVFQEIIS